MPDNLKSELSADFVLLGYLCQNDETGEGPTLEHRRNSGGTWTRDKVMKKRACPDCWPVYRERTDES